LTSFFAAFPLIAHSPAQVPAGSTTAGAERTYVMERDLVLLGVYASERAAMEARVKYWNAKARGSARLSPMVTRVNYRQSAQRKTSLF
jgi:hypothetical protein